MRRKLLAPVATRSILLAASAGILALGGCASTRQTARKDWPVLVCPECRMVAETPPRPYFPGYDYNDSAVRFGGPGGRGTYGDYRRTQTVYKDICPGCQGVIETLFKEGRWKHTCSVCKDTPFTCPIFHPLQT